MKEKQNIIQRCIRYVLRKETWIGCVDVLMALTMIASLSFSLVGFSGMSFQGIFFDRHIALLFGAITIVFLWLVRSVIAGSLEVSKTPLDVPLLLCVVVFGVASFLSSDTWHSIWGFWERPGLSLLIFLCAMVFYYATFHLVRAQKEGWLVISASCILVFMAISVVWWGVAHHFLAESDTWKERLWEEDSIAFLTLSLTPILLGALHSLLLKLRVRFGGRNPLLLASFFSILVLLGFFSLELSWGWISAVVGAWFFFALPATLGRNAKLVWFPVGAFLLILLVYLCGGFFRVTSLNEQTVPSHSFSVSWEVVKGSLGERTFFGQGPTLYSNAFALYRPLDLNQGDLVLARVYQSNGLWSEIPVTLGIFGAIAFILIILLYAGVSLFGGFEGRERHMPLWIGMLVSSFFLMGALLFTPLPAGMLVLWFCVMAMTLALSRDPLLLRERIFSFSFRPSSEYSLSVAFAFLVVSGGIVYGYIFLARTWIADAFLKIGMESSYHDVSIRYIEKAIDWYPNEGRYYTFLGQQYLALLQEREIDKENEDDLLRMEKDINKASEYVTKGKEMMPEDVVAWEVMAQVYDGLSFYAIDFLSVTRVAYQGAVALEPQNPRLYSRLGEVVIREAISIQGEEREKKLKEAKDILETALSKKGEFPQALYLLALTQEGLGEVEGAIQSMLRAVIFVPQDANALRLLARLYTVRDHEGDREKAKSIYETLISREDVSIDIHYALGMMYAEEGALEMALQEMDKALSLISEEEDEPYRGKIEEEKERIVRLRNPEPQEEERGEEEQELPDNKERITEEEESLDEGILDGEDEEGDEENRKEENTENDGV